MHRSEGGFFTPAQIAGLRWTSPARMTRDGLSLLIEEAHAPVGGGILHPCTNRRAQVDFTCQNDMR
jgi:hypothetical protein